MKTNYLKKTLLLFLAITANTALFGQIIADGTYKILNSVHSEVITLNTQPQPNPQDVIVNRAIMAAPDENDDNQLWTFTHQGNDIYKIENNGNSNFLGVKDGWCGNFGDVQATFDTNSLFILFKVSAGVLPDSYVFEIAYDADCTFGSSNNPIKLLDIDNGNSEAKINTFRDENTVPTPDPNANQQFQIVQPSSLSLDEPGYSLNDINLNYSQSNRSLTLSNNQNASISKIQVFDITGKSIKTLEGSGSFSNIIIDFQSQINGLYFVRLESAGKQLVKKVMVY